jgi:hypothetical protein
MPINKDVHITAEILSLLRSGFYGQILFEGALAQLNSSLLPEGYLTIAHKAFDKLDEWQKDLDQNIPIFASTWTQAETFDAIAAMNFLRDVKRDLLWLIPKVERALAENDLWSTRDSVKLLAAGIVRSAATRNSYIEAMSQIYMRFNAPEYANPLLMQIDGTRQYLNVAQYIVQTFSTDTVYDPDLCEKLRYEAALVPSDLLSSIHDINIMLHVFAKEFSFEMAEISKQDAAPWEKANIPPIAAGYWRAYGFTPQEFKVWADLGITGAPLAANWRRVGFKPEDASIWIQQGIVPALAKEWRAAGFGAERTAAMLRRGISDPKRAPTQDSDGDDS